jgi:mannose-1-phosphate guanylyltransferase
MQGLWGVVLAGGQGTRFWPRSRRARPKQCLALDGDRTLIQQTTDRVAELIPPERVLVATGADMLAAVREQLPDVPADNFLVEPRGRNTAPCIGWAAVEVGRRGGDAMAVLPSDHRIANEARFRAVLAACVEAARTTGALVLLGQQPTCPHTGYGYLAVGAASGTYAGEAFFAVARFIEKPDLSTAERLLAGGGVLWNGGMFVWTVPAILEAYRRHLPLTHRVLGALERGVSVQDVWDGTDATSIDYGVLEREEKLLVVPCEFGWSDLGAWTAMEEVLPATELGAVRARDVVGVDSAGLIVDAPDRVVAALGVRDLIVVDAGDVLLLCAKDRAQRIPELLERLRQRGLDQFT